MQTPDGSVCIPSGPRVDNDPYLTTGVFSWYSGFRPKLQAMKKSIKIGISGRTEVV